MLLNGKYIPPPPSKATCQLCQDLNIRPEGEKYGSLGILLQDLSRAQTSGCLVCPMLFQSVSDLMAPLRGFPPLPDEEVIGFTIQSKAPMDAGEGNSCHSPLTLLVQTENTAVAELEMYTYEGCSENPKMFMFFYFFILSSPVLAGKPSCWSLIGPARDISFEASAERCMSLASEWVTSCIEKHASCPKEFNPILPDRVLYVGNKTPEAYLHINENQGRGNYIALSHCWGGKNSLCTYGETLKLHKQGIPFSDFPKTFQHAILVCRGLGIDYLWIDSLCIIQDSKEDWAVQAARMANVYSNSWVTIAADAATNSDDGFIGDERRQIKVKKFKCPGVGAQDSELCIRKKGSGPQDSFSHHFWTGPARSPLSSRGWVLQESVLAPRILHFTAEELTWECAMESRCECQLRPHHFSNELPLKVHIDQLPFRQKWASLVQDFSERVLTVHTDRLHAMSGLALWMQKSTNASYWAGLWSDQFPRALLWWVLDRRRDVKATRCHSKRILPYQAPTWSWASVTGRVLLHADLENMIADLENIKVEVFPASANPYGSLRSAQITAKGYLVSVQVSNELGPDGEYVEHGFRVISERSVSGNKLTGAVVPDIQDDGFDIDVQQLHCVLIVGHTGGSAGCILLRNVPHTIETYERVGYVYPVSYEAWSGISTKHDLTLV